MYIPYYDEFLVYTTKDDIFSFMENVIKESGFFDRESLKSKSMKHFGSLYKEVIMDILTEYDYK